MNWRRNIARRLSLALLLAVGIGDAHGRQGPFDERSRDPLSLPRPQLAEPLILPVDQRLPADKIVGTMPAAIRLLDDPSSVRVIVTLHEPLGSARSALAQGRQRVDRLARVAALEHDFATAASRLGFKASGGLTNFAIVAGEISPDRLAYLAALPQVSAIEPDRTFRAARVEGAALIHADDLRDAGGDGHGITVVVLDSGINASHGELAGKVVEQRSYNGPVGQDGFNHGTQVAGIIAGDGGVAPQALLWDVRVIGNDGLTTTTILIQALDELIPDLASFRVLVGAFGDPNFRFTTPCDQLNPAAAMVVQTFRDAGKFMVAAAGDAGDPNGIAVPACLSQILATGAVYDGNVGPITFGSCTDLTTAADKIACYSNGGQLIDFYAPGHCTRTPRSSGGFDECFGGTSPATAFAAGAAAQIWSLLPSATLVQVENALKASGPNLVDSRTGIARHRIDVFAAHASLAPDEPTPTPTRTPTQQGPGPTATPTRTPTVPGPTKTPTIGALPGTPSGLTAQTVTHTTVLLEWAPSPNETDLRVEARTAAGTFQEVATLPANTTFFPVEDLQPGTAYFFRVRAHNAAGFSNYSNTASATTAAGPTACVRDTNTACLLNGQFRITGEMKNFANPPVVFPNRIMSFPGGRAESDLAAFFDAFNRGNFEIGVKMVNGCLGYPVGHPLHHYWLFAGGLTNARTDMEIEDTVTGQVYTWTNMAGPFPTSIGDNQAFPCVDPGGTPDCTRDGFTACLIGGRFKVSGTMSNNSNPPVVFPAQVMQFPSDRAETDQAAFIETFNVGNFEIGTKMVNGCAAFPPGHPLHFFWIFYGGLTNAGSEVRAVHVPTGRVDIWRNPSGTFPTTVGRTKAFPCS